MFTILLFVALMSKPVTIKTGKTQQNSYLQVLWLLSTATVLFIVQTGSTLRLKESAIDN